MIALNSELQTSQGTIGALKTSVKEVYSVIYNYTVIISSYIFDMSHYLSLSLTLPPLPPLPPSQVNVCANLYMAVCTTIEQL